MVDIKENVRKLLFESGITNYRISKDTGVAQTTLGRFTTKKADIGNMSLDNAIKLNEYYLKTKEELQMKWEFEDYKVYEETDVLRFENNEGEVIGYVGNIHENNLIEDLNNGADPIEDGWEDGVGNTISIDGWGN